MNEDPLFLACTRPAMFAGVTIEAMALNVMATTILFILTSGFSMLGLGVGMHFVLREVTKYDHNQFRVLFAWLNTRGKQKMSIDGEEDQRPPYALFVLIRN